VRTFFGDSVGAFSSPLTFSPLPSLLIALDYEQRAVRLERLFKGQAVYGTPESGFTIMTGYNLFFPMSGSAKVPFPVFQLVVPPLSFSCFFGSCRCNEAPFSFFTFFPFTVTYLFTPHAIRGAFRNRACLVKEAGPRLWPPSPVPPPVLERMLPL